MLPLQVIYFMNLKLTLKIKVISPPLPFPPLPSHIKIVLFWSFQPIIPGQAYLYFKFCKIVIVKEVEMWISSSNIRRLADSWSPKLKKMMQKAEERD